MVKTINAVMAVAIAVPWPQHWLPSSNTLIQEHLMIFVANIYSDSMFSLCVQTSSL